MNASEKLRFQHGIYCLVFSYVCTILGVLSYFLWNTLILIPFIVIADFLFIKKGLSYFKKAITISDKTMNDSRKLIFEHGICCLIFSHITLIGVLSFLFIGDAYIILSWFCLMFFAAFIVALLDHFKNAIISE